MGQPKDRHFLGFSLILVKGEVQVVPSAKSLKRAKVRLVELTPLTFRAQ
ncbi:MAG: hypothetical protein GY856_09325 [bacterium]|nr:hypothetical protein [bacterium]